LLSTAGSAMKLITGATHMVKAITMLILAIIIPISLSGCCTLIKMDNADRWAEAKNVEMLCNSKQYNNTTLNYSGTYYNVNHLVLLPFTCQDDECWFARFYPFILIGALVDLPFDVIADTLYLPHTLSLSQKCGQKADESTVGNAPEFGL